MFAARVKVDGRLFVACIDDTESKACKLESGRRYWGLLYDSIMGQTPYIEWNEADFASLNSDELEALNGEYRLIRDGVLQDLSRNSDGVFSWG